jgi:hypothetical protein
LAGLPCLTCSHPPLRGRRRRTNRSPL